MAVRCSPRRVNECCWVGCRLVASVLANTSACVPYLYVRACGVRCAVYGVCLLSSVVYSPRQLAAAAVYVFSQSAQ